MPFLTPDDSSDPAVSVALTVPPELLNALSGAMYELSLVENWEKFGDMTPEECAGIIAKAWRDRSIKDALLYQNLVAAWDLNESSGVRHDWHGGHHLTDNYTVGSRTGLLGQAASFIRANSEYLSIADSADFDFSTKSFTLMAWVLLDDKTTTQRIWLKGEGTQIEFLVSYNLSVDRFLFQVSENGTTIPTGIQATTFGSPAVGNWNLVTVQRDEVKDKIRIQINDTAQNELAFAGNIFVGSHDLRLSNASQPLNGALSHAFIWDAILTKAQIDWIYNSGNGRPYSEIISYTG